MRAGPSMVAAGLNRGAKGKWIWKSEGAGYLRSTEGKSSVLAKRMTVALMEMVGSCRKLKKCCGLFF